MSTVCLFRLILSAAIFQFSACSFKETFLSFSFCLFYFIVFISSVNVSQYAFESLTQIIHRVSELPEAVQDKHGRNSLLSSYVAYMFNMPGSCTPFASPNTSRKLFSRSFCYYLQRNLRTMKYFYAGPLVLMFLSGSFVLISGYWPICLDSGLFVLMSACRALEEGEFQFWQTYLPTYINKESPTHGSICLVSGTCGKIHDNGCISMYVHFWITDHLDTFFVCVVHRMFQNSHSGGWYRWCYCNIYPGGTSTWRQWFHYVFFKSSFDKRKTFAPIKIEQ